MFTGASQFAFVGVAPRAVRPLQPYRRACCWASATRSVAYLFPRSCTRGLSQAMDRALRDRRDNRDGGEPSHPSRPALCLLGHRADLVLPLAARQPVRCTYRPRDQSQRCGLDAAAPAVFLALLWPSLRRREARWVALGGAAVALALVPLTPPGIPVIAAASVALVAGLRPSREDADIEDRDPS